MKLTVSRLDVLIIEALESFYFELLSTTDPDKRRSWFQREQEIVSLFALGHLAGLFRKKRIDIALMKIEGRVPQEPTKHGGKRWAARDLVIFPHRLDTVWRPGNPSGVIEPLAVMEWKLCTHEITPKRARTGGKDSVAADIAWLKRNSHLMGVGYSVFVQWPRWKLGIRCERILNDGGQCKQETILDLPSST